MATVTLDSHATAMLDAIRDASGAKNRPETVEMFCRAWLMDAEEAPEGLPPIFARRVMLPVDRPVNVSEREWQVVTLRYIGGATLERVARHLGVTRERVRQLEVKALRKHREWLAD